MTTVINTPGNSNSDSGFGLVFGIIIAIGLVVLFVIYGLPALRRNNGGDNLNVNVTLPGNDSGSTTTNP